MLVRVLIDPYVSHVSGCEFVKRSLKLATVKQKLIALSL